MTRAKCWLAFAACSLLAVSSAWAGENRCPGKTPESFVSRIQDSKALQARYTKFPIKHTYVDQNSINLNEITIEASSVQDIPVLKNEKGYIILPRAEVKKSKLHQRITHKDSGFELMIHVPDGDSYIVIYKFERAPDCWYLREIDNLSL